MPKTQCAGFKGIYDRVADPMYKVVSGESKNRNSVNIGDGGIN